MSTETALLKEKRRSKLFRRASISGNKSLLADNFSTATSSQQKQYLEKLQNEEKKWKEYMQKLKETYKISKILVKEPSRENTEKFSEYLEDLSDKDKEFLQMLNKTEEEYYNLQTIVLPKLKESLALTKYEFFKQIDMEVLLAKNYEMCIQNVKNFVFSKDENDVQIIVPKLESLSEDSAVYNEPFLLLE